MVDEVFDEKGVVEPARQQRLVVRKADDVLGQHIVGRFEVFVPGVGLLVAGPGQQVVQRQVVSLGDPVAQVGTGHRHRTLVMPQGLAPPTDFTVTAVDVGSVPVITAVCRIDGLGMVPGLGDGGVQPHPFRQEIRLFVAGGHVVRKRVAFRHTDDVILRGTRLDVLVDLGDGSRYEESIGPAAVLHPGFQLAEQREIVVVETRQVLDHEGGPVFVAHFHVAHQVVVL